MTITSTTFARCARAALPAILFATLLGACGGGGGDVEELDATEAGSLREPGTAQSVHFDSVPLHEARTPAGGWRRAPICLDTAPACPPNVPPTH
jgi:hypothetical protein